MLDLSIPQGTALDMEIDEHRVFIDDSGLYWIALNCVVVRPAGFEPATLCLEGVKITYTVLCQNP